MPENFTAGELAQQYDDFTIDTVLDTIRSRKTLGASAYEIHLMVMPEVKKRFNGIQYSRETLDNDLYRLLQEGKLALFAGRYTIHP